MFLGFMVLHCKFSLMLFFNLRLLKATFSSKTIYMCLHSSFLL